jgi:N,N'-diacetyllegionaminate synthase
MKYFNTLTENCNGNIYVIAEACDNHMGSLDMARALVDAAIYAGADAVKFQHHLAEEEMLPGAPMSKNFAEPLFDFLKRNSLTLKQHYELYRYCSDKKITYLCTPFSLKAAIEIAPLVPFIKIGSGEFQDHWYIDGLRSLNLPVLFSSGMCSWTEICQNLEYIRRTGLDFGLMNCLSEYPPVYKDMNLRVIEKLIGNFPDIVIGHSDHSPNIDTSIVAAAIGANIIEKHLTLSEHVPGPDKSVSLLPDRFRELVESLRQIKSVMGIEKTVHQSELSIRLWAYRSVVAVTDIKPGDTILEEHLCTKRPGTGIPSSQYKTLIGKIAKTEIKANTLIDWSSVNA